MRRDRLSRRSTTLRLAVPLLVLALAAAPGFARARGAAGRPAVSPGPGSDTILWLRATCAAFPLRGLCAALVEKIGCRVDPNGACQPTPTVATPPGEIGCSADPSGLCRTGAGSTTPQGDIGCGVDPDGRCTGH